MLTLQDIYGDAAGVQAERYQEALDAFAALYGPGETFVFRAPGRVNVIGEHTDYNHGYVLPAALDRDIVLIARPRPDGTLRLANLESDFSPVEFVAGPAIPPEPRGSWSNYARGPAQTLAQRLDRAMCGFDGLISGAAPFGVPRGAGLSSSSALTVVAAVALAHFNGWNTDGVTLAQFCSEAEWYAGTRGGIMDHFIAVLASRGSALFLDCRPGADGQYPMRHFPLPRGYRLLVVDSGVHHQNARGQYNERVAACRAGVALLRRHHPEITHLRDVQDIPWDRLEPELPEQISARELQQQGIELGDIPGLDREAPIKVRSRCRHVWTENHRVLAAVRAMENEDVTALGLLLNQAHASARDDYETSCPEVEVLVTAATEVEGVAGARLTGAGWGGCIVALVRAEAVPAFEAHVSQRYLASQGRTPAIFACRPGPGAGRVSL